MGILDIIFWPFQAAFIGVKIILAMLLLVFWIWMIVDCVKRKFRNENEKIIWIIIIAITNWLGAFIYLIAIRFYNPRGLYKN